MRVVRRVTAVLAVFAAAGLAWAFDGPGHHLATRLAIAALPAEVPAFLREGVGTIANASFDPDLFKLREMPQLRNGEYPEHYFDVELLEGATPPATRYEFLELCAKQGLDPSRVGLLPYAIAEWTQRLTIAFAECRRWPDNEPIRAKCLVYAGLLAHYAQDLCQPLHTTIDYDGRARPDGSSPRSGIHARFDALIQKVEARPVELLEGLQVRPFERLWPAILAELDRSHALVDRTYELGEALPDRYEPLRADPEAAAFARERLRACAAFTGSLYLTAWRGSASLELPEFHVRERSQTEAAATQPVSAASQPAAAVR